MASETKRTTVALGAAAALGAVGTMNAFTVAPLSGGASQVRPSLRATAAAAAATPSTQPVATTTATAALAAGAAIAAVATAVANKRGRAAKGMKQRRRVQVVRKATSALERERCDHHGFMKGDPEFDVTDASTLGAVISGEFKKRPSGVKRYSHGNDGKGCIILDMQESSRYPGDPKGQAFLAGCKKHMVIKSIGGQEVLNWDFVDIMDLWDDYDFEPTDDARAKKAWLERERKYQAIDLPVTVEFQECTVTEIDEDAVAEKIEGKWYPRPGGYTDEQLAAELARVKKESPVPADYKGVVYSGPSCLNDAWIKAFMEQQKEGVLLPISMAYELLIDTIKVLKNEKFLGEVTIPEGKTMRVVGDTHGQYWDVMNLYKLAGMPSKDNPFMFNGDLVDRGSWGIENIFLVFAMKVKDPANVHLNRGNHELIEANMMYGFTGEVFSKYDRELFNLFSEAFRNFSLAHVFNKEIMVVHGGIPGPNPRVYVPGMSHDPSDAIPKNRVTLKLEEIAKCDREFELQSSSYKNAVQLDFDENTQPDAVVPEERICIDMIWGDPRGTEGYGPSYRKSRGVFMFGPDVSEQFCKDNNLKCVIRSHEVKEFGWKQDHPQLYTVFSAPNYMDTGGNKGAFMTLKNEGGTLTVTPTEFDRSEHPDVAPMIWQNYFVEDCPHLTKKMKKRKGPVYDSNGMLVAMSKGEMEDAANQWVEDDEDEGNIDGVAPGATLEGKASGAKVAA